MGSGSEQNQPQRQVQMAVSDGSDRFHNGRDARRYNGNDLISEALRTVERGPGRRPTARATLIRSINDLPAHGRHAHRDHPPVRQPSALCWAK